jgi:hypothetical protein
MATGHLKTKTGFRHRPTRRFSFNLAYDRLVFNGLLFIYGARSGSVSGPCYYLLATCLLPIGLATGCGYAHRATATAVYI